MADDYGDLKPYSSLPPRLNPILKGKDAMPAKNGKEPVMINMQLTLYDIQITEIEKRIERLEKRNEDVEDQCVAIEVATNATDTETADDIARITKLVRTEQTKVDDLKQKVQSIETTLKEETKKNNKKTEEMNEKYNRKRLSLLSKVKVLNAKINALEDFKRTQPILQEKLEKMANFIGNEQERVKQTLDKIERKFRLDREKLKKDMYNRLLGLAGTFQIDVSKYMSPPVHRLLRENLMLRSDLDKIGKMYPSEMELERMKKAAEEKYQDITAASISEARKNMIAIKIQKLLINLLKEKNEKTKEQLSVKSDATETENEVNIALKVDNAMKNALECEGNIRRLEVSLIQKKGQLTNYKFTWKKIHCNVKRLLESLFDLKFIVSDALQMNDIYAELTRVKSKELIPRLLNVFEKTMPLQMESTHTMRGASTAYIIGDLGFDPKGIDAKPEETEMLEFNIPQFCRSSESDLPEKEEESSDTITQVAEGFLQEEEEWDGNEYFEEYAVEKYIATHVKSNFEDEEGEMDE